MYRINLRHDLSNIDEIASAARLALTKRYPSTIRIVVENLYGEDVIVIHTSFPEFDVVYRKCTTEKPPDDSIRNDPYLLTEYVNKLLDSAPRISKRISRSENAPNLIMNYYLEMLL